MAKYVKGQTGNKGGRPKGVPNKTTAEIKEIITKIVGNQLDRLEKDLDTLRKTNPSKAIDISTKLIDYVIPRMSKLDVDGQINHKVDKLVIEIKKNDDSKHRNNTNVSESAGE
jgi:transcription initiation factor TFIIIB Brf1 subunit/transcription initiation factor TFIIB